MRGLIVGAFVVAAAVAVGAVAWKHTAKVTKIDDEVTVVTIADLVIVMRDGTPVKAQRLPPSGREGAKPPLDIKPKPPNAPRPWTLPFTCSDAKYYSSHFTQAQLDGMRKAAGMRMPTAAERQQISDCIAGRIR